MGRYPPIPWPILGPDYIVLCTVNVSPPFENMLKFNRSKSVTTVSFFIDIDPFPYSKGHASWPGCKQLYALVPCIAVAWNYAEKWFLVYSSTLYEEWNYTPIANNRDLTVLDTALGYVQCLSVRDVTWMSDQSVHLAKLMAALEQVTRMSKLCKIPDFCARHLAECH